MASSDAMDEQDDAMDEQTLVYWLNSLPVPSALLVSSIRDLDDGDTIIDVVAHLFPEAEDDGPLDLQGALACVASGIGGLPQPFGDAPVAYANVLGGGHYALCWVAAVLRFAAGDGPALGFKGSGDFQTFVDMSNQMDRVGSPRQEWGMANGSPARARALAPPDDNSADGKRDEELPEAMLPTALPTFDDVWRKADGQWRPAALPHEAEDPPPGGNSLSADNDRLVGPHAQPGGPDPARDPTDDDAMQGTTEQRFGALERRTRVDLSARPAKHAQAWNASTYVEHDAGIAAAAPPVPKQQLMLADAAPEKPEPRPEKPLWTRRGTVTERGLVVGTLCDPAPGSRIPSLSDRHRKRETSTAVTEVHKAARRSPSPQRRASSHPRAKAAAATRRKQQLSDHELDDQKPVELDARADRIVKWLQTMPLDIGPLGKAGLRGLPVARRVTVPRETLRKAFGPGRLLCQLVNVLEETHVCTSTKSQRVNVNKALAILRLRPSMTIEHLWATDELLDADPEVTFALLEHIRSSYAGAGRGGDTRVPKGRRRPVSADKPRPPRDSSDFAVDMAGSSRSVDFVEADLSPPLDANGHALAVHAGLKNHWAPLLPVERRSLYVAQQHENSRTDETTVRHRLRKLGFDIPSRARLIASNAGLLQDPLRNGTLLCALVERLDPRCKLRGVAREPDSVDAAVANVEIAFSELRRLSSKNAEWFSSDMAHDIVRGRQDLLWGLLVRVTGPLGVASDDEQIVSPKSPRRSSGDATTTATAAAAGWCVGPYTVAQTRLLEVSLVQWVHSLGYLPMPSDGGTQWTADEALDTMLRGCSDGTLLCDLTAKICGEQIPGVTRRPRIAAAQLGNISKAFDVLRRRKIVDTQHLRCEEDVRTSVRGAVLGLLEAMHRAYDGVPRSKQRLSNEGEHEPYLGKDGARGLEAYAKSLEASVRATHSMLEEAGTATSERSTTPTRSRRQSGPDSRARNRVGHASAAVRRGGASKRLPSALKIRGPAPSLIPVPTSSPISSTVSSPRMSPREWDSPTRRRRRQQVAATGPLRVDLAAAANSIESKPETVAVVCETEATNRIKVRYRLLHLPV
jgi:hypothetical protein